MTELAARRRLSVLYRVRNDEAETRRMLSPQRPVHYRDNWCLDAWCHSRRALRSSALERIREARLLDRLRSHSATALPTQTLRHA